MPGGNITGSDIAGSSIAFYSPLKPINHPTPSGDRLMARQLVDCLSAAGHRVEIASHVRAFVREPHNETEIVQLMSQAQSEVRRLSALWKHNGVPVLWFCYHPYYKSPDLIGPELCRRFKIPYITAEASYSARRAQGVWAAIQDTVLSSIKQASVNICFTERDSTGLQEAAATASLARLQPFIDTSLFANADRHPDRTHQPVRLVAIAMMRSGDKMASYTRLAAALKLIRDQPWTLSVVGDGALKQEVKTLFEDIPVERIQWHGLLDKVAIAQLLQRSSLYVWPGCGEAYGLAYLEAQAAGVPAIAYDTAGVPEVVRHEVSGLLTEQNNDTAYADALSMLIADSDKIEKLSDTATRYVQQHHSMSAARQTLHTVLQPIIQSTGSL